MTTLILLHPGALTRVAIGDHPDENSAGNLDDLKIQATVIDNYFGVERANPGSEPAMVFGRSVQVAAAQIEDALSEPHGLDADEVERLNAGINVLEAIGQRLNGGEI